MNDALLAGTTAPRGRREANRERTRLAIEEATYALLEERGLEGVTAELVADRAQISRRTFFNYYSSVEAVLADPAAALLEELSERVAARPATEPLFTSVEVALTGAFSLEHLRRAAVSWRAAEHSEATARHLAHMEIKVCERATEVVVQRLEGRGQPADPLTAATLAGALIAAERAARMLWLSECDGRVTSATRRRYNALLRQAIAHLATGFSAIDPARKPPSG